MLETGIVVLVVERSKRKNGSKRSQGNMEEIEDVSHPKTMPLKFLTYVIEKFIIFSNY